MPYEKFNGSSLFGTQTKIEREAKRIREETEKALKNIKALPAPIAPPEESPGKKPDQPFTYRPGQIIHVDNIEDFTPMSMSTITMICPGSSVAYFGGLLDV